MYHTPPELLSLFTEYGVKEVRHSNEHCQAQNGMVGNFGYTLGRGLCRLRLQSELPFSIWDAAAILITDIYNLCTHSSLNNETPFSRRTGRLPDLSSLRPFGCGMVVFLERILRITRNMLRHEKSVFTSAQAVNLGAGLSWDILQEPTVCMQA